MYDSALSLWRIKWQIEQDNNSLLLKMFFTSLGFGMPGYSKSTFLLDAALRNIGIFRPELCQ